jgi:transposase
MSVSKSDDAFALRWAKKMKVVEILGGRCEKCGNDKIWALEFHHHGKKDMKIGHALRGVRFSELKEEIKKCVLLCADCHFDLHSQESSDSRYRDGMDALMRVMKVDMCEDCNEHKAIDFHHYRGKKIVDISNVMTRKCLDMSPYQFIMELDKCVALCRNCHAMRHFDKDRFERLLPLIKKKKENYKETNKPINKSVVKKMIDSGISQNQIANDLGCAKSTISRLANMLRPDREKCTGGKPKLDWESIKHMLSTGMNTREIANEIGASESGVQKICRRIRKGEI